MNAASRQREFDIAVIGGGAVGLVFARLLALGQAGRGRNLRVAIIEAHPPEAPAADESIDLRVSAIAPVSRAILQTAEIWQHVPAELACSYERMCVWQAEGSAGQSRSISFDAAENGAPDLGHIVENRAVRLAAWDLIEQDRNTTLITGRRVVAVSELAGHCVIELDDGEQLRARLTVGADGARSPLREMLGVEYRQRAYGQSAVVAHIATELPHAETAWQRFLETGPVALLPLADGRSSLVWSCPEEEAAALVSMDTAQFTERLEQAVDRVLGAMECTTARAAFPLAMGYALQYTGQRFALIGDAAHQVHPLAGQGVNLGLLDAATLAEQLLAHCTSSAVDPGDPIALRRYERARKGDNLLTLGAMDALNNLFSGPAGAIGGWGLEVADRLPPLKSLFVNYATGYGRDLPAAARLAEH